MISKFLKNFKNYLSSANFTIILAVIGSFLVILDVYSDVGEVFKTKNRIKFHSANQNSTIFQTAASKSNSLSDQLQDFCSVDTNIHLNAKPECLVKIVNSQFLVIGLSYLCTLIICTYIAYLNKSEKFSDIRRRLDKRRRERFFYYALLLVGFGPIYFTWYEIVAFVKKIKASQNQDEESKKGLKSAWKTTVTTKGEASALEDGYLKTMMLVRVILEDIPFLYVYTVILTRAYEENDELGEECSFNNVTSCLPQLSTKLVLLLNILSFIKEYLQWILAMTFREKSRFQNFLLIFWNLSYIILGLLAIAPVILSLEVVYSLNGSLCDLNLSSLMPCVRTDFKRENLCSRNSLNLRPDQPGFFESRKVYCNILLKESFRRYDKQLLSESSNSYLREQRIFSKTFGSTLKIVKIFIITSLLKISGAIIYSFIKIYKIMIKQKNQQNLSLIRTIISGSLLLVRTVFVYLVCAPIYILVPFAGGKKRSLLNSLLLSIQYAIIFINSYCLSLDTIRGSVSMVKKGLRELIFGATVPVDIYDQKSVEAWKNNRMSVNFLFNPNWKLTFYDNSEYFFESPNMNDTNNLQILPWETAQSKRDDILKILGYYLISYSFVMIILTLYMYFDKSHSRLLENEIDYIGRFGIKREKPKLRVIELPEIKLSRLQNNFHKKKEISN